MITNNCVRMPTKRNGSLPEDVEAAVIAACCHTGISASRKALAALSTIVIYLCDKQKKKKKWYKKWKPKKLHSRKHHSLSNSSCSPSITDNERPSINLEERNGRQSQATSSSVPLIPCNVYNELMLQDIENYRCCLKMTTDSFIELLNLVKPLIQREDTRMKESISAIDRLGITLRYLALGETQTVLSNEFNVAQNTISGIIPEVSRSIFSVLQEKYLKLPNELEHWKSVAQNFGKLWGVPWCIGVLDVRQLKVTLHPKTDSNTSKMKTEYPLTLIVLVDADHKFIMVDTDFIGNVCEANVWDNISLCKSVESSALKIPSPSQFLGYHNKLMPYVFLGHGTLPLKPYIVKPFYLGSSMDESNNAQRTFNYRIAKPLTVSENAFGILGERFRVFKQPLRATPEKGKDLFLATIVLHNFLMSGSSKNIYDPPELTDTYDVITGMVYSGQWRETTATTSALMTVNGRNSFSSTYAENVRNSFCHYFYPDYQTTHQRLHPY